MQSNLIDAKTMQFDFMYRNDMKSNSNKGNSEKKIINWE